MSRALRIAIVYPGNQEVRRQATTENNRFAALFAAFAANGVEALPAVYNRALADELRDQLLQLDGAPVTNVSLERTAEYKLRTRSLAVFAGRAL